MTVGQLIFTADLAVPFSAEIKLKVSVLHKVVGPSQLDFIDLLTASCIVIDLFVVLWRMEIQHLFAIMPRFLLIMY